MTENIYVYATLFSPENGLDLPEGIESGVELISNSKIAAIIERNISIENLQKTEDTLLQAAIAHDRVIQAIFHQASLLPLRFGTGFVSTNTLLEHLTNNQSQYLKQLQVVNGKVEYNIKFIPLTFHANNSENQALKGKSYLLAKKKKYQIYQEFLSSQENQWREIKENLTQEFLDNILIEEREYLNQIFLLETQNTKLDTIINTWQKRASKWQITISQPLPCYHFVPGD